MDARDAIAKIQDHIRVHQQKEHGAFYITEALNLAVEALEKQVPKKAIPCSPNSTWTKCPVCGATDIDEYCGKCGQRLDWGTSDENT